MKKGFILFVLISICMCAITKIMAQQADTARYAGAKATKKEYKVAYQMDSDDSAKIVGTLGNMENALADERLKGKLTVELVVHGPGIKLFMKGGAYEARLKALKQKGVIMALCLNTMHHRNVTKEQVYDFIGFTPSGNGELIILEQQGWAVIHP